MSTLFYVVGDIVVDTINAPRASAGTSITVSWGSPLGKTWPQTAYVFRAGVLVTALTITARTGRTLTTSGAATGFVDAALVVGDVIMFAATAPGSVAKAIQLLGNVGADALAFPTMHDAAAIMPSVYLSLDQLDTNSAPKLTRIDAAGNVNVIG